MNKQSKSNRRVALKNFHKGNHTTNFTISKTISGSSLSSRIHSIEVGNLPRKTKNPKVGSKSRNIKDVNKND